MNSLFGGGVINQGLTTEDFLFVEKFIQDMSPAYMLFVDAPYTVANLCIQYPGTTFVNRLATKPRDDNLHRNVAEPMDYLRKIKQYDELYRGLNNVWWTFGNELPADDPFMYEFVYNGMKKAVELGIRLVLFNFSVTFPQYDDLSHPYARRCLELASLRPDLFKVGMHLYKNNFLQDFAWLDLSHNKVLDAVTDEIGTRPVQKLITEAFWDGQGWRGIADAFDQLQAVHPDWSRQRLEEALAEQMIAAVEENWLNDRSIDGVLPFLLHEGSLNMWKRFSLRHFPHTLRYLRVNNIHMIREEPKKVEVSGCNYLLRLFNGK